MVGVSPVDFTSVDVPLLEHLHALHLSIAVTLPGFRREDGNVLQDPHRWHPVDNHLSRLPSRRKDNVLILQSRGMIGLGCGQQIVFGQSALLHDFLQRLGINTCPDQQGQSAGQHTQQPASNTVHHGFFLHSFFRSWFTSYFPKPGGLGCFLKADSSYDFPTWVLSVDLRN